MPNVMNSTPSSTAMPVKTKSSPNALQWLLVALMLTTMVGVGYLYLTLMQMNDSVMSAKNDVMAVQIELMAQKDVFATQSAIVTASTPTARTTEGTIQNDWWKSTLPSLSPCDAAKQEWELETPSQAFPHFGLEDTLNEGFRVAQACYDATNQRVAFILVKQQFIHSTPDFPYPLWDEQVEYRTLDVLSGDWYSVRTVEPLGIYGEAYNRRCFIDTIIPGSALRSDAILFYCGSGESGGITDWYQFAFGVDHPELVTVQRLTSGDPETFDVRHPELLKSFKYQSRASMR